MADDYFNLQGVYPYSIIRSEISEYPNKYKPESELFNDYYNIAKNGFINDYSLFTAHNDIDDYQNGTITLDEAVEMYQREVDIWLNE